MKQIVYTFISALVLTQIVMVSASDAKEKHGSDVHSVDAHAFPGAHFAGKHAGFGNHYDNLGRWGNHRSIAQSSWGGWGRPRNRFYKYGWGGWSEPMYGGPGYSYVNRAQQSIDVEGTVYPTESYSTDGIGLSAYNAGISAAQVVSAEIKTKPDIEPTRMNAVSTKSVYKLGPDVDILDSGNIAVPLNENTFLLVEPKQTLVVNRKTGIPAIALYTDPLLLFNIKQELKRQELGLEASKMDKSSEIANSVAAARPSTTEVDNLKQTIEQLKNAESKLGNLPDSPPKQAPDPVPDAIELFASVWLLKDGSFVLYKDPDGSLIYMNDRGTFTDRGKTARQVPYPDTFESTVYGFLKTLIDQYNPTMTKLNEDKDDTEWALSKLAEINEPEINQLEASQRLAQAVSRSERRLNVINAQITSMPDEVDAAKKVLSMLEKQ